ncbi:uncharacterized protein EI90DRAFT_3151337 [Cantharellus anzutake]|uniref:uncharacterized protein n=1 Tax=Cantharellus anzutake TaxID=1750568 RepID=UPI0019085EAC|nr:uncharacterized protein EI90DRAFT_3151337 [Cantharellus anzutake]KAF8339914.1 hypothetical protein EI90DRAFT_3151337 [Cantharellus anzutake]
MSKGTFLILEVDGDGVSLGGNSIDNESIHSGRIDAVWESETTEKLFTFAPLLLTEDDLHQQGADLAENVGVVKVKIYRATARKTQFTPKTISMPGDRPIHEKNKKAVSHAIRLGEVRSTNEHPCEWVSPKRSHGAIMYEVDFRYAPIDYLRARGIAPQLKPLVPPEPAPQQTRKVHESTTDIATDPPPQTNSREDPSLHKRKKADGLNAELFSDDSLNNLTPEEQEMYAILRKKAKEGRKSKKPKHRYQGSTAAESIVISD